MQIPNSRNPYKDVSELIWELKEEQPSPSTCGLCGTALGGGSKLWLELIGFVCPHCEKKLISTTVYKCLFCRSAGFMEETIEEPFEYDGMPEVMITLSCPFCQSPANKLPV